jgi:hypothetical protein
MGEEDMQELVCNDKNTSRIAPLYACYDARPFRVVPIRACPALSCSVLS